jgi:glycerol-3-phosphate dehydrogenase
VLVPDGTLDAYRLPLQFLASCVARGAVVRNFTEVVGIERTGGAVTGVVVYDRRRRREERVPADVVINAGGPWAGKIAALCGILLPITPAPGTMVAVKGRLTNMVVSHLHPSGDGDIVVPQRRLSIIGSTQWTTDDPELARAPEQDIEWLLSRADDLVPGFSGEPFQAAWTAVRPLAGAASAGGRELSRNFDVVAHTRDGAAGFYSIIGGKATVLRAMAEHTVDRVCRDLGLELPCATADTPLLSHRHYFWSCSDGT